MSLTYHDERISHTTKENNDKKQFAVTTEKTFKTIHFLEDNGLAIISTEFLCEDIPKILLIQCLTGKLSER